MIRNENPAGGNNISNGLASSVIAVSIRGAKLLPSVLTFVYKNINQPVR
jgi:hypothetical protein